MSGRLEAWLDGAHAGQFVFEDDGTVRFEYAPDAPATPISLSLPRGRPATRRAAVNFLENLLPDHEATRARMAKTYGAASTRTIDLLAKAGGDLAGGLLILPEDDAPDPSGYARLTPALDRDVAERIDALKRDPDAWAPVDVPARFSLAGTQGKFALARVDGDWYWPDATVPSTHILKPGRPDLPGVEPAEVAALTLAAAAGVPAPHADILTVEDQTTFIVERFDRHPGGLLARRLHAEDLAQALGVSHDAKYDVTARQIVALLTEVDHEHPAGAPGPLVRGFLAQLALNTLIGNADAHAKNYSVLLTADAILFAPLYDAVPVGLYPEYDQDLAMRIAGARFPQAVRPEHWRKLARTAGLDEDETLRIVTSIAEQVAERNDTAWVRLDPEQREHLRRTVERNTAAALGDPRPPR